MFLKREKMFQISILSLRNHANLILRTFNVRIFSHATQTYDQNVRNIFFYLSLFNEMHLKSGMITW